MFTVSRLSYIFSLLIAPVFFSAFIYLTYWGITNAFLHSLLAVLAVLSYLNLKTKKQLALFGFFTGVLWFWWVGLSFQYYALKMGIFICGVFFGFLYSIIFMLAGFLKQVFWRALFLVGVCFFEPFNWNWFKPQILLTYSYFGKQLWQTAGFFLVLGWFWQNIQHEKNSLQNQNHSFKTILSLQILTNFPKNRSLTLFSFTFLLLSLIDYAYLLAPPPKTDTSFIKTVNTAYAQDEKWRKENYPKIKNRFFQAIKKAQNQGYKLIVFPETMLPVILNYHPKMISQIKKASQKITILTGALFSKEGLNYNSSFLFTKGQIQIIKKHQLVPFGEYIPLPKWLKDFANRYIFDGTDFTPTPSPTIFKVGRHQLVNAICYEVTTEKFYQLPPKIIVASSNLAWFYPSIGKSFQKILIDFYSQKYNKTVVHAINHPD